MATENPKNTSFNEPKGNDDINPEKESLNEQKSTDDDKVENKTEHLEKEGSDEKEAADDEYRYIKRNEFTSEIFKIEIMNIPLNSGFAEVKKLLKKKLNLNPNKIKVLSAKRSMYAFVNFRNEEDRVAAIEKITGHVWKSNVLKAKKANPMADPFVQKRKLQEAEDGVDTKKAKHEDDSLPISTRLNYAVTPLWDVPYDEQLKGKEEEMKKLLKELGYEIEKINPNLRTEIKAQREKNEGLCCEFLGIKPSPKSDHYRNKCEFSIGHRTVEDNSNKTIETVGFRLSRYSDGSVTVVEPDQCCHINDQMKSAASALQTYIQRSAKAPFCVQNHTGYWRQFTVRTSRTNDMMGIVVLNPQDMSQEEIEVEKESLAEFFKNGDGKKCAFSSMYLQLLAKRKSNEPPPTLHIFGATFIKEKLFDLTFHVSPEAFFQVNTSGAEVLYSTVEEMAELNENTTLLDVCCGAGTIGLSLAKKVSKVIGIEMNKSAIEDAKENIRINEIKNADFLCGTAESKMYGLIQRAPTDEIVAVVDPPRAGLHPRVVKVIRSSKINKVVYVSCNPSAAKNNFLDFCRAVSNSFKGSPFYPSKAVAVDMFPHTSHCELVMVFDRIQ